jgi:hypothetical protein
VSDPWAVVQYELVTRSDTQKPQLQLPEQDWAQVPLSSRVPEQVETQVPWLQVCPLPQLLVCV